MADVPPLEHAVTSPGVSLLSITFEELSVAEEALRAQDAELERYRELFQHAPVAKKSCAARIFSGSTSPWPRSGSSSRFAPASAGANSSFH